MQGSETVALEKLRQLEVNGSSASRKYESAIPNKEAKDKRTPNQLLVCFGYVSVDCCLIVC